MAHQQLQFLSLHSMQFVVQNCSYNKQSESWLEKKGVNSSCFIKQTIYPIISYMNT